MNLSKRALSFDDNCGRFEEFTRVSVEIEDSDLFPELSSSFLVLSLFVIIWVLSPVAFEELFLSDTAELDFLVFGEFDDEVGCV